MENFKKFIEKNREKIQKGAFILGGIILCIIVIFVIVMLIVGRKISYPKLEEKLINATEQYLMDNLDYRPSASKPEITVDANTLITAKYIKELRKYVKDTCSATIKVKYATEGLEYQAFLDCDNFQTKTFNSILKEDNKKTSQTGEGVYNLNDYSVFRGQDPHNYVSFANMMWRIVKYNDKEIRLILDNKNTEMYEAFPDIEYEGVWDDRYNSETESRNGVNNFSLSIVFDRLRQMYNGTLVDYQDYLTPYNLCVGKRDEADGNKAGNQECTELISNQYYGLLPVYDYLNASLSNLCTTTSNPECQNYNYLNNEEDSWWTMTPNSKDTYSVYYVNPMGQIDTGYGDDFGAYRIVIALKGNVLYDSGKGTLEEPYVIR